MLVLQRQRRAIVVYKDIPRTGYGYVIIDSYHQQGAVRDGGLPSQITKNYLEITTNTTKYHELPGMPKNTTWDVMLYLMTAENTSMFS